MEQKYISIRAFAKKVNVTEGAVRRAIAEGKLHGGYDEEQKKIILSKAIKSAWAQSNLVVKPKAGVSRKKVIDKLNTNTPAETTENENLPDPEIADAEDVIKSIKITKDMPLNKAMQYREIVGLAMDKIKLQKEQGVLVEKAEVERTLFAFGTELKRAIMDVPKRVTRDIMVAPNEVEATNILTEELTQVLLKLTDIKI